MLSTAWGQSPSRCDTSTHSVFLTQTALDCSMRQCVNGSGVTFSETTAVLSVTATLTRLRPVPRKRLRDPIRPYRIYHMLRRIQWPSEAPSASVSVSRGRKTARGHEMTTPASGVSKTAAELHVKPTAEIIIDVGPCGMPCPHRDDSLSFRNHKQHLVWDNAARRMA
jgi:hypothetical protein